MFDSKKFIVAFLATLVTQDMISHAKLKGTYRRLLERHIKDVNDYNALADRFNAALEEIESSRARTRYLARIIDENEIELDEFDEIALNNL